MDTDDGYLDSTAREAHEKSPFHELRERTFARPVLSSILDQVDLIRPPKDHNSADEFKCRLDYWIADFERTIDPDSEVGVRLVSFGQAVTFYFDHIGYWNPSLIKLAGYSADGEPMELIQHVSQISILLTKLPKLPPEKRIGFHADPDGEAAV